MKNVVVVNKTSLEKKSFNEEKLSLNTASIIHLKVKKEDVAEFIQQGNTLIVKLKNGEILTLENFFEKNKENVTSDLVFEDDACAFLWFNYENGIASFKSISGLEELLPAMSTSVFSGMTPWLLGGGAALLGGLAAGGGGSGSNEIAKSPNVKVSIDPKVTQANKTTVVFDFDQNIVPDSFNENSIKVSGGSLIPGTLEQIGPNKWIADVLIVPGQELIVEVLNNGYQNTSGLMGSASSDQLDTIKITGILPEIDQNKNPTKNTVISGKTTPNTDVEVTLPSGDVLKTHSDESGDWSVISSEPLSDLKLIIAEIPSKSGGDAIARDTADLPFVYVNTIAKDDVINAKEVSSGKVEITGTWSYPHEDEVELNIVVNDKSTIVIPKSDGTWSVWVDKDDLKEGVDNEVKATIFVKNDPSISNSDFREPVVDTIINKPQIDISNKGLIEIKIPGDQGVISMSPTVVEVFDSFGVKKNIEFILSDDGKKLTGQAPEGLLGELTVKIPNGSYLDWAGNIGLEVVEKVLVDTDFPQAKITIRENGEIVLTYPSDVDPTKIDTSKVIVSDNEGKPFSNLGFTKQEDGSYLAKVPKEYDSQVTVNVPAGSYFDLTGNIGRDATNEDHVDTLTPTVKVEISKPDGDGVSKVTFIFSEKINPETFNLSDLDVRGANIDVDSFVKIIDIDEGSSVEITDLKWEMNIKMQPGQTAYVGVKDQSYQDVVGNLGKAGNDQLITINIVDISVNGDKVKISGKTEPEQVVKLELLNSESKEITSSIDDGTWEIEVPIDQLSKGNIKVSTTGGKGHSDAIDIKTLPHVLIDVIAGNDKIDLNELTALNNQNTNEKNLGFNITGSVINPENKGVLSVIVDGHVFIYGEKSTEGTLTFEDEDKTIWKLHLNDNSNLLNQAKFKVTAVIQESIDSKKIISNEAIRNPSIEHNVPEPKIIIAPNGEIIVEFFENTDGSKGYDDLIHLTKEDGTPIKIKFDKNGNKFTGKIEDLLDENVKVTIDIEYKNSFGDVANKVDGSKNISVIKEGSIDTIPPSVEVNIDNLGNITLKYDADVDPKSIDLTRILIVDKDENSVPLVTDWVVGGGNTFTGKVNIPNDSFVKVDVPTGSFADAVGNKGTGDYDYEIISKVPPAVFVEFVKDYNTLNDNDQIKVFNVKFSEEIKTPNGETKENYLKKLIENMETSNIAPNSVEIYSRGGNQYEVRVRPQEPLKLVEIKISKDQYQDLNGNNGSNSSEAKSDGVKNVLKLVELGVDNSNTIIGGVEIDSLETFGVGSVSILQNSMSKYGQLSFNETKHILEYKLNNDSLDTQKLKQGEVVVEEYSYQIDDGVIETLAVKITGTNDKPVLEQTSKYRDVVNEKNSTFSSNTLSNPTVVNSQLENRHGIKFQLNKTETSTTQIYVNLKVLDNSFKVFVNGKSIHLNEVFQIEAGDITTPIQVPLKFADGTWLASGAPWNANEKGLARFQIIISENGVRFFGTKTTKSEYLEEIFYDSSYGSGIQLPTFKAGENLLEIVSVDGVGIDSIQGYATISAGGMFELSDVDSEKLSKIELILENGVQGKDIFTPVLPKGITYLIEKVGESLKLTLFGEASKADYQDVLNSLMFKSSNTGEKKFNLKVYDDYKAYDELSGILDYKTPNQTVKITSVDFNSANKLVFNENSLADLLNNLGDSVDGYIENNFILKSSQKIDVSALLSDAADNSNLYDYIFVDYDEVKETATISIDRDGVLKDTYQKQELLVLTNQKQAFDLDDLLANNQIVY